MELKNILFYFGHPAQYYFLKFTANQLKENGHNIRLCIKSKDILEDIMIENKEEYINILPEGRGKSKPGILLGLVKRDFRLFNYVFNKKIDLLIGTDPSLSHVGWLLRIPVLTVLEDDIDIVPTLARLTFPFTKYIIAPEIVKVGRFSKKKIGYNGYMKLAYLHPKYFSAKGPIINQPYFLIRLSGLDAYHDRGIKGFNEPLLDSIIDKMSRKGDVYISSEKLFPAKYEKYKLKINPSDMHQFLANSTMLISDSQSMSMEAAMLGVPSIRFSDFAGRINVLEELEREYQLTFGIPGSEPQQLINKIDELLSEDRLYETFQLRREKMLFEKIDVTAFMVWFIENYPESVKTMKENPGYQFRFK
jgi:uncharacterized protein